MARKADYGLDAPSVVRNLLFCSAAGLALFASVKLGFWSGKLHAGRLIVFELDGMGLAVGIGCGLLALYMIWSSYFGKLRERDSMLDQIPWRGDERTLDVGCGRGLLLIGCAKRLSSGIATGIDLWQQEDLSGNKPEATMENARAEGVGEKVRIETGDMRKLPFPDASFDVVTSMAAIHNIYEVEGRATAVREIVRVLKPGGSALIDDIRHLDEYRAAFAKNGVTELSTRGSAILALFWAALTWGSLRPGQLIARKSA